MKVSLGELRAVTLEGVQSYGYGRAEAETICEVLIYAQLRGNSQGVVKLIGLGIPRDPDEGAISVLKETEVSALVDGAGNQAMVVVNRAVDLVLEKVADHGLAVVGVHGIGTSSGALGYYARRIAEEGFAGIVLSGAPPKVAPEGGYEAVFGTNPLAISVKGERGTVTLDMATAAMALYGVIEADTAGRSLPADVAYDEAGRPTTGPAEMLNGGALRTFDRGPKSSGLSFMVQALTGPLVGASFAGIGDVTRNWGGHLVIAIDPDLLGGREQMEAGMTALAGKVKGAAPLSSVKEIYVPGERGDRQAQEAMEEEEIEIEDNLYEELRRVAGRDVAGVG
jgi:L-2-hydroxycarboxylate dehydrogenase (NAD+)